MAATTRDQLVDIVVDELRCSAAEVTDTATMEALGADSLDAWGLVMRLEDECAVTISDDEAEAIVTFGDLVALVERKRSEA